MAGLNPSTCVALLYAATFVAIIAYIWPRGETVAKDTICDGINDFEFELCQLYIKCVKPLETSYKFSQFESLGGKLPLSKMYFSPHKPLILLIGPYSSGEFESHSSLHHDMQFTLFAITLH